MTLDDLIKEQRCVLTPNMSARQAVDRLAEFKAFYAPLVDTSNNVIAVLSQSDLLRLLIAGKKTEPLASSVLELAAAGRYVSLRKGDSIAQACKLFLANKLDAILVVDGTGRLQGAVSQMDLMQTLVRADKKDVSA